VVAARDWSFLTLQCYESAPTPEKWSSVLLLLIERKIMNIAAGNIRMW